MMKGLDVTRFALLSVTNKKDLESFAANLQKLGFKILSTGGSASYLRQKGIEVIDVDKLTDSPELFNGRVKTLHPIVHGGILYERNKREHSQQAETHKIPNIELVAVNLYDFAGALQKGLLGQDLIESIDIGGPAMLRAAAKNHAYCLPVCDPTDYTEVIRRLDSHTDALEWRQAMATKVFALTARYDAMIAEALDGQKKLRYGENPHQTASLIVDEGAPRGVVAAKILGGKELSYNNYLDLDAGLRLVGDFGKQNIVAILKHTNPCGAALARDDFEDFAGLFKRALQSDPTSAFGGIIATNCFVDKADALDEIDQLFFECLLCKDISPEALKRLSQKKNRRILTLNDLSLWQLALPSKEIRSIVGGFLKQDSDSLSDSNPGVDGLSRSWNLVSNHKPNDTELNDLSFAWRIAKNLKSNAIALTKNGMLIGMGAGQTSRIDALDSAIRKASEFGHDLQNASLASDAFFPFSDCVEKAVAAGIRSFVQPGGSIRDQDSIDAVNNHGASMLFTGRRHFKH